MYIMGIDIGSTNWKVAIYALNGECLTCESTKAIFEHDNYDQVVYNPDTIWNIVCQLIRRCLNKVSDSNHIISIACSSIGESGVLLDSKNNWLYPIVAWFETKTQEQRDWWEKHYGLEQLFFETGIAAKHNVSINRIMWIKKYVTEVFNKASHWLCLADFIAYKLSGIMAMDYSLASRTMMLDLKNRAWSDKILDKAGIQYDLLPSLVPSGEKLGHITQEVSEMTGLSTSTVVAAGGHDQLCGNLAVGVKSKTICDSIGTGEALTASSERINLNKEMFRMGLNVGFHVINNRYYIMRSLPCAGGLVEWLKNNITINELILEKHNLYKYIINLGLKSEFGSKGLFFLPFIYGKFNPEEPTIGGSWIGLRQYHDISDLIRSLFEGLCYEFTRILMNMEKHIGGIKGIKVIGGGTKNILWMQSKADISRKNLYIPHITEPACLGAALLGAKAAKVINNIEDGINNLEFEIKELKPLEDLKKAQISYKRYCELVEIILKIAF